ncbi:MAG TPA: efflux RND transporter periplasmic adaptor subunit [Chlamydiales bacterium]|nr:efflux RND transporter periplasmic adaptor subunit [Chlamydiales bacterium]
MKRAFTLKRLIFLFILLCIGFALSMHFATKTLTKSNTLTLYGNVDVRLVDLGFRVFGRVTAMPFEEGDFVPQGAFMGAIDQQPYLDQVRQAQAAVEAIKCALINDERNMKRREAIVGAGAVSDEEYQNALTQKNIDEANLKQAIAALGVHQTNLYDTEFCAPADGTILTRVREPGTVVNIGEPIYTLSLISPIWIRAFIDEPSLGLIYPGMPAEIFTDSGGTYQGHIGFISPVAEFTPKTVETTQLRTDLVFRLRVIADNPDQGLRQGMPVTVKLPLAKKEKT